MTETETRAVLLMRAVEQATLLPADDAAWAGREARRQLGEAATAPAWLARRASLGLARLAERDSHLQGLLSAARQPPGAGGPWLLIGAAALLGVLSDALGGARHINLLALPLLGLLLWNAAVYAALAWHGLRRRPAAATPTRVAAWVATWVAGWTTARAAASGTLSRWSTGRWPAGADPQPDRPAEAERRRATRAALLRFGTDWLAHSAPLQAARVACWLHAAAAALALGIVASMYARGLVFDYQAGWDSTFLQPAQVHRLLTWLLGPASALGGLALPDADALAGLRLSAGGGEGAAPWIHRWALTLGLAVVLPRCVLAGIAGLRARRLARRLPWPDEVSLQRLLQTEGGPGVLARSALVLPYSYQLDAARQAALGAALANALGPGLQCRLQASLPLGAEDHLSAWLPAMLAPTSPGAARAEWLVLVFALTATPERETHGALLSAVAAALAARPAPRPRLVAVVDESGFRQRLDGPDAASRLARRRAAWSTLLQGPGVPLHFVDLTPDRTADRPGGAQAAAA